MFLKSFEFLISMISTEFDGFPVISIVSVSSHFGMQKSSQNHQNHYEIYFFRICSKNVPGALGWCGGCISMISTDFDVVSSDLPDVSGLNHLGIQKIVPKSSNHQSHHEK